jgi:rhodanese-related sulfurtransferase
MVNEAQAKIMRIAPEDAARMRDEGKALLVDIRDIRELDRVGRIADAFHAPRGMLEFWVDPKSPYFKDVFVTDKAIILFCTSGWRSALAARTLNDMGMENACDLDGGLNAWGEAGLPIAKTE